VIREHIDDPGLDPEVRAAMVATIQQYQKMGCTIVDISLPNTKYAIATYYIIAPSEASSNLSRFDGAHYGFRAPTNSDQAYAMAAGSKTLSSLDQMYSHTRSQGFGSEVKRRIMLGTYTLSEGYFNAYYLKALKVRRLIRQDYDNAFGSVDVVLGPTTPTPAFRLGEKVNDPVTMYLEDLFTVGANLAGIPALSIPVGKTTMGLPIGAQLQGPPLAESKLMQIAHAYQLAIGFKPELPASVC
jgi:aspartyl-tRNA(Asn)/glutamyl-tRNA(Gln) amidotransferase subunit A